MPSSWSSSSSSSSSSNDGRAHAAAKNGQVETLRRLGDRPEGSALLSKAVDETRQGEVQGISASLNAVAFLIGPIILTNSFAYFTASDAPVFWPGAPFAIAALLVLLCMPLMVLFLRRFKG